MNTKFDHQHYAVVYLRVASAHKADGSTIARQREGCLRLAARHGLTVIREYVDIGRSARLDHQVELRRLLDDLDQQRDSVAVIVWDYARLGRSMTQLDDVIHRIHSCGAEVITITGVEAADRFIRERQIEGGA
jgi:DNA invertase Pin-like site-specific DNA recombinase